MGFNAFSPYTAYTIRGKGDWVRRQIFSLVAHLDKAGSSHAGTGRSEAMIEVHPIRFG